MKASLLVTPHGATLDRGTDEEEATLRTGNGALDEKQPALRVDLVHDQGQRRRLHGAHTAGHLQALEHATGGRRATDGTGRPVLALGTVRRAEALEAVTLHDAGGALALAGADDVDLGHAVEDLGGKLLADRVLAGVLSAQFHQ